MAWGGVGRITRKPAFSCIHQSSIYKGNLIKNYSIRGIYNGFTCTGFFDVYICTTLKL